MILKTVSTFSLTLLAASLLSACGSGGGSSNSNNSNNNNNNNNNVSTGSGSTPTGNDARPSLSLNGPNPQVISVGDIFINQGANASDVSDGDLSSVITENNNVDTSAAGCYQQNYSVSDSDGNLTSLTRNILVGTDAERHSPNTPPTVEGVSLTNLYNSISTVDVLANASDADCDPLSITYISEPEVGTAKLNADNTITFDPLGNVGSHFFIFTVSDGYGGSDTQGFTIASVDPEDGNDNWPDVTGESVSTSINTSILIDVLANDSDADGDALVLDGVDTPQHGTIEKRNGKVFYTPDLNYTGEDYFYYGVHDNHGHNGSGLVEITITE